MHFANDKRKELITSTSEAKTVWGVIGGANEALILACIAVIIWYYKTLDTAKKVLYDGQLNPLEVAELYGISLANKGATPQDINGLVQELHKNQGQEKSRNLQENSSVLNQDQDQDQDQATTPGFSLSNPYKNLPHAERSAIVKERIRNGERYYPNLVGLGFNPKQIKPLIESYEQGTWQ